MKATNYLLKPVDPKVLISCLEEIEEEAFKSDHEIIVKGAWWTRRISTTSIEFLEANGKHVKIALANGEVLDSIEPLCAFEERLSLSEGFYKCHRSYLVNINHVHAYTTGEITMRSGRCIPIARRCHTEFKDVYFSVIFRDEEGEA